MKKTMIKAAAAVVLAAVMILPLGCVGPQTADSTASDPLSSDTMKANVFTDMLRLIPATENTTNTVYVQDYSRLPEEYRLFPPPSPLPEGYPIMQNNRFWNLAHYDPQEWKNHMGFNQEDMAQEAFAWRMVPMDMYEVVRGNFDKDVIENALKSDPINDDLVTLRYAGLEYFSAGEDGMSLQKRSQIRPLGQALRLAVLDNTLLSTSSTLSMQNLLDVYQKNIESLADLEAFRQLAEGMERLDAMAAIFSSESQAQSSFKERFKEIIENPGQDSGSRLRRNLAEQVQRNVLLQPYEALAVGFGTDDKGEYMAVVLVNPDESTAKANASLLERQIRSSNFDEGKSWAELVTSIETTQDGDLVLAKLYGEAANRWKAFDSAMLGGDPLLMYWG